MANIVFVVTSFTGHLNATFKLAADLRQRGHRITYLGRPESRARVELQGFAFEAVDFIHDLPADQTIRALLRNLRQRRRAAAEVLAGIPRMPATTAALIQRLQPDLLIFDPFYLMYAIPFYRYRIPTLVWSINPLLDYDPFVPPYTSAFVPDRSLRARVQVQAIWLQRYLRYQLYLLRMWLHKLLIGYSPYSLSQRVAAQHSFPLARQWATRPVSFDYSLAYVPELVLHSQHYELPRADPLRPTVHYVGPCVDLERVEPPFDWDRLVIGEKLIVCSIGTVGPKDGSEEDFLRRVIAAVATLPRYTLLLAAGPGIDLARLGMPPPNVYLYSSVPQIQVLRRADLMINHGGDNSVKECILLGVPMLVYARRADQPGNSARVLYHKLGLRGDIHRDTSAQIAARIAAVLSDPRYVANVARMRAFFEADQRSQRHITVIESFLAQPQAAGRATPDDNAALQPGEILNG